MILFFPNLTSELSVYALYGSTALFFHIERKHFIMDNARGHEGRKGQPHNNAAGGIERTQAPTGFEGMNYEQKRRPYRDGKRSEQEENEDPGSNDNLGRRQEQP